MREFAGLKMLFFGNLSENKGVGKCELFDFELYTPKLEFVGSNVPSFEIDFILEDILF
jgi:hypothetical protein